MLHDKMRLQKQSLPLGLTFEQFWARMKHHSRSMHLGVDILVLRLAIETVLLHTYT